MKTELKKIENDKSKLNLRQCLIYDVFIRKNNRNYYVGQIHFAEMNDYWTMNFKITNTDMNLIKKEFFLKARDSGLFSIARTSENEVDIQILIENKLKHYFVGSHAIKLERNYNFS
jgi:hypothetical protein